MENIREILKKDIMGIKAEKVNSEPGDGHKDGAKCIIIAETADTPYGLVYLALFNDFPLPVAVADFRIKLLANEKRKKIKLNKEQQDYLANFPQLFNFYIDEQREKEQKKAKNSKKSSQKQGN